MGKKNDQMIEFYIIAKILFSLDVNFIWNKNPL